MTAAASSSTTTASTAFTTTSTTPLPEYEVEQKFALRSAEETTRIETRLKELGFEKAKSPGVRMVDWYWDDATDGSFSLTTQDCWLRLRQIVRKDDTATSCWQLKMGHKVPTAQDEGEGEAFATVYEEVAGPDAVTKAMSLLPSHLKAIASRDTTGEHNNNQQSASSLLEMFLVESQQELPKEMTPPESVTPLLAPFAKIETRRSSWVPSSSCRSNPEMENLKVDFDTATYGSLFGDVVYAVGEVEEVVHNEDDISSARTRVKEFTKQLAETTLAESAHVGKLEYYLIHHRPKHFQAIVDCGIFK